MKSTIALCSLSIACAACSTPSLSLIPRYGTLDIDGKIGINDSNSNVSSKNSTDELGLQKDDSVFGGRVDLDFGSPMLSLAISDSSHGGHGTLEANISDGDTTITAGTDVTSRFDLTLSEGVLTFDLVPGDTIELGIGLGVSLADVDASFEDEGSGESIDTQQLIPIPLVALRAGVDLGRFDASALVGGMDLGINGDHAKYLDLDLMGRLRILGSEDHFNGALVVGYRWVDVDLDYEDDNRDVKAELKFNGPYVGISLTF